MALMKEKTLGTVLGKLLGNESAEKLALSLWEARLVRTWGIQKEQTRALVWETSSAEAMAVRRETRWDTEWARGSGILMVRRMVLGLVGTLALEKEGELEPLSGIQRGLAWEVRRATV